VRAEMLTRGAHVIVAEHPHPLRGGKQPRILFGTQASTRPPTFVLFTTGFLDPGETTSAPRRPGQRWRRSRTRMFVTIGVPSKPKISRRRRWMNRR
jgi:GTP-binding protein